jgi:hypothetical protein
VTLSATESDQENKQAGAFKMIAERVLSGVSAAQRPAPTIRMEE